MDHIVIYLPTLVICSTFGLPILCGADGEFAVNIAYGKPATQSSTYIGMEDYGDTPGYPYNASLAVDGNKNTRFKDDGCSHTTWTNNSAWWEVDLQDLYKVLNITIYQRTDEINVAEKKLANQSSVYNENTPTVRYFNAPLAVDGNTNTDFEENSCSCTNPGDINPWWEVDLQGIYFLIGIRIYQRFDSNKERLKGFTLFGLNVNGVYERMQPNNPYKVGEIDIRISPPRMVKKLMVQLTNTSTEPRPIITLCEVQAFAGTMCSEPPQFPRRSLYKFIPGKEGNWPYNF